jgi:hypothetical protein
MAPKLLLTGPSQYLFKHHANAATTAKKAGIQMGAGTPSFLARYPKIQRIG